MDEDKIYKFGDQYYSIDELYEFYSRISFERQKEFKDCVSHSILAEIFKKAGFDKESNTIMSISNIEYKRLEKSLSKPQIFINKKLYTLYMRKLFGIKSITKEYKISEFINGKWILGKLVSQTLGSSCDIKSKNDLELIDYTTLKEDECKAIVRNYKRNLNDEELEFYRRKILKK